MNRPRKNLPILFLIAHIFAFGYAKLPAEEPLALKSSAVIALEKDRIIESSDLRICLTITNLTQRRLQIRTLRFQGEERYFQHGYDPPSDTVLGTYCDELVLNILKDNDLVQTQRIPFGIRCDLAPGMSISSIVSFQAPKKGDFDFQLLVKSDRKLGLFVGKFQILESKPYEKVMTPTFPSNDVIFGDMIPPVTIKGITVSGATQ